MMIRPIGRGVFAGLLLCCSVLPASAQIFSWRDANGNLVLSNKKPGAGAEAIAAYAVPQSEGVRTSQEAPARRNSAYNDLIVEHARRNSVRQSLVRAVIQVESAFNPSARSPKGAMGLMQLMPATAREFGVHNAFDPAENVRAGVAYLRQLLDRYDNDEALALAAYNAGPGAVDRYGQSVPPYVETKNYVLRVNTLARRPVAVEAVELYRIVETIGGREVIKYTDRRPQ
jgi:soluble lytic murein transglycosylase-like protein